MRKPFVVKRKDDELMKVWAQGIEDAMKRMEHQDAEIVALRQKIAKAMTKVDREQIERLERENAKLSAQLIALHEDYSAALQFIAVLSAALRATYSRMVALAAIVRATQVSG